MDFLEGAKDLTRYMDLLSARQKLSVSNIANAATPGYKTRDIDFAAEFQNALDAANPAVVEVGNLRVRNDGNNVSLDRESRLLAETAIRFKAAAALFKGEVEHMRKAIESGRGS